MKGKAKIIAIVAVVMAMIIGTITYGVITTVNAKGVFGEDGYVLGNISNGDSQRADRSLYFLAGDKYQKKYPDRILLNQKEGADATIEKESFVHFMNNDLLSFSDGVFLDMDSLGEQTLSYYNIPAEVLVKKQNGSYIINTSSQEERFQNLIWKISAEKYMAVSETVLLHLSDEVVKELSGYVEINFVDQDVVQLVHQDGTYQTISGDAYIELANGARLNLATRSIVYGEEEKLSLAQMVIDSDDNIEVVDNRYGQEKASAEPSGESSAEPSASNGQGGGNNQNSNSEQTNNGQNNSGGGSGNEGGGNSEGEGDAPEVDTDVAFPTFSVTNFETDVVSVDATIEITDDDGLLSEKGVDYSIIERGTNKLVYKVHKEGVFDVRIGTDILSPDTEYTLIANSDYIYKDETYNKDFVSYIFRTDSVGVAFKKSYITEEELALKVSIEEYSSVTSGMLNVYAASDPDTEVASSGIDFAQIKENGGLEEIVFPGLSSNTEYIVTLEDLSAAAFPSWQEKFPSNSPRLKSCPRWGSRTTASTNRRVRSRCSLRMFRATGEPAPPRRLWTRMAACNPAPTKSIRSPS